MIKNVFLIQLFILIGTSPTYSQKSSLEIGGKLISEWVEWESYAPGIGVQAIYKITDHSGIETGLYYMTKPRFYFQPTTLYKKVNEKTILIPLLYKFDSRLINFTAGFAIDYLIDKNQPDRDLYILITNDKTGRIEFLPTFSISKNFYLNESLIFEPEIRGTSFIPRGGGGFALNFSLRKKVF